MVHESHSIYDRIPENYVVLVPIGTILGIWIICHFISYWIDRKDRNEHLGISVMCDIAENFSHDFYLLRVVTGSRISAGTTANVYLQIYGEKGRSKIYTIKDETVSVLNRGGDDSFFISSPKQLGPLEKIRIWHDNSGSRPGWYLRKILIRDVKSGRRYYFFADTWLSLTYEKSPTIIREFPRATKAEINSWKRRFNDRVVDEFNNSHLWFSMFFRLPTSNFTRCQRLVCSFSILLSHMLVKIMFEGVPAPTFGIVFHIGDFEIDTNDFMVDIQIAMISAPIGIILILLFRRIRKRHILTLIVWKDRVQAKGAGLNYHEEFVFLPDKDGEFKDAAIPVTGSGDDGQTLLPFAIPETDIEETQKWIRRDTKGYGIRPVNLREPDAFIRKVPTKYDDPNQTPASHLLRIGRQAVAEAVRKTDRSAFIYSGHGDFESQFDADVLKMADLNHPWTKLKKRQIQGIENRLKSQVPNIVPIQLVKKSDVQKDTIYHGIFLELCVMKPAYKKKGYLPWWFLYISWTIAILTMLLCAYLTVLRGLYIGRGRSMHWLSEITSSFIKSIFITQPIRIILVASVLSLIYRKIHATEEDRFQVILNDGKYATENVQKIAIPRFKPFRTRPPLSGPELRRLRLKARRRNELKRGIIALCFHILAMIFLASIISNSSSDKFAVTSHVRNMLGLRSDGMFFHIRTTEDFYGYMMGAFAEIVNPLTDYNGIPFEINSDIDPRFRSTMFVDNETMMLGVPRIRQVRVKISKCPIHKNMKRLFLPENVTASRRKRKRIEKVSCTRGYESLNEDTDSYAENWVELPEQTESRSWNDVWSWKTPTLTRSVSIPGKFAKYDPGGYVAELGMHYYKTIAVLDYLDEQKWIDGNTRAIFVEMSVIVPNVNMFADILLMLERSLSGSYIPTVRILPLQITFPPRKGEVWWTWTTVCYVGIALYTGGLILSLGRGIAYHWHRFRAGFVKNFWLWLDFFIGVTGMLSLGVPFKFNVTAKKVQAELDTSLVDQFISLQRIAFWDYVHLSSFAAVFGLCIIKSWRFLILLLDRFYILALTLRVTARFLFGYAFIVVILVGGFACWGVLGFGQSLGRFHSIGHAFLELIYQVLEASFYHDLVSVHTVIGRVYYLIFGLCLVLVGVNLFVALLSKGFVEAKEIAKQKRHRETYWSALKKSRLRRFFCWTSQPKNPDQKLAIPPMRLKAMEVATAKFLRACVQAEEYGQMAKILKFCNEGILKGTGQALISKEEKKDRIRKSMNTTLTFSKVRMEQMREATIRAIRNVVRPDLTPEEIKEYAKFHMSLLELKLNKVRKVIKKMNDVVILFFKFLDKKKIEAEERAREAEAIELEQKALGWRRYLPPELVSSHPAGPPSEPHGKGHNSPDDKKGGTSSTTKPENQVPRYRHMDFF